MRSFGFESTTDDVLDGIDLTGKRILVTGASAGLGVETTRALAAHGASVTMAVRDLAKGAAAMEEIRASVPDAELDLRQLDLADLASVRTFAHGFVEDHPVLHVLIANAGVMACPQGTTVDGFETQFGTNHLGHFLLIQLLTPVARGGRRRPGRAALVGGTPLRRRRPRRSRLRAPALRPVGGLRPRQDRQRAVRGRARPAPARPGCPRLRGAPGRHPHRARPPPHRRDPRPDGRAVQDRQRALEDGPAGRRHHRVRRHRSRARRRRRRLPRGLPHRRRSPTIPRSPAASAPTPSIPPAPTPSGSSASAS